jgi:hypothetical protein
LKGELKTQWIRGMARQKMAKQGKVARKSTLIQSNTKQSSHRRTRIAVRKMLLLISTMVLKQKLFK